MGKVLRGAAGLLCLAGIGGLTAQPQGTAVAPTAAGQGQAPYTLHVNTRVVLTDVTVTDKHGNPVQGLDRSAFHIFDNGQPQQIASFVEHTEQENVAANEPRNPQIHTNAFLRHAPPALDAILLDLTTIHIVDQMYLAQQLHKFIDAMPPGALLSIYARVGDFAVPLQDFTADHALLHAAVRKAIPRLQQPGSWAANEMDTLEQMVHLLAVYPGRKDLIWFSGGSNLALMVDAGALPSNVNMQPIYDDLERTRIAVYPVDARGLTVSEPGAMPFQHIMMAETAEATGGRAFYNNNGFREIASRIVGSSSDFYTLSYSPQQVKFDDRWHKVKVTVEGQSYQLSYRHGYFDDGSNITPPSAPGRKVLTANGETRTKFTDLAKDPIVFWTKVRPQEEASAKTLVLASNAPPLTPPRKNERTYDLEYILPAADFLQPDGRYAVVQTGVLAVNTLGRPVASQLKTFKLGIDAEKLKEHPQGTIRFDEQMNLPVGQEFLTVAVWDEASGRVGTMEVPVTVAK